MNIKIRKHLNQKGFTLVELMVVIAILGILAAIAIPRFSDQTTSANTAKIAADLRTIDGVITMAVADGAITSAITTEADVISILTGSKAGQNGRTTKYLAAYPSPPSGSAYKSGATYAIKADDKYAISGTTPDYRASLDSANAETWHK